MLFPLSLEPPEQYLDIINNHFIILHNFTLYYGVVTG